MNRTFILQKEILYPNASSGSVYKVGTILKHSEANNSYYVFPDGNLIWASMVESHSDWFIEEKSPMDKAWGGFYTTKDNISMKELFESGWYAAEKHFTQSK